MNPTVSMACSRLSSTVAVADPREPVITTLPDGVTLFAPNVVHLRLFGAVPPIAVDGGVNPRKSGDDRKAGTRFAARDQSLLAIVRSDANGCSVALCQRRQPPKAGAVGLRLQRGAGQPAACGGGV